MDSNFGYHLLVLRHGAMRRRLLFEPDPQQSQSDSLAVACLIEEAADQQSDMQAYIAFAARELQQAGYRLVGI